VPIEGRPADVVAVVEENRSYLGLTLVPKLLLTFEPGVLIGPKDVERYRGEFANLEVRPAGKGLHYVQEDEPETIGRAIADWRRRKLS
jgi:haloalkane dehalogenase